MIVTLIRGLPGSGKSTRAKELNCLHLESDFYFQRDGRYAWNEHSEEFAQDWSFELLLQITRTTACDLVVANVFPTFKDMERFIYTSIFCLSATVCIETLTGQYNNIHHVRESDMQRFRETFISHETLATALMKDERFSVTTTENRITVKSHPSFTQKEENHE